ncbi:MAG: hypothetical protein HQM09_23180 [Candidatus Riflebacteria bacterium]|nr:hypothetical protein [Candidatus Riflebacteria bacterium]
MHQESHSTVRSDVTPRSAGIPAPTASVKTETNTQQRAAKTQQIRDLSDDLHYTALGLRWEIERILGLGKNQGDLSKLNDEDLDKVLAEINREWQLATTTTSSVPDNEDDVPMTGVTTEQAEENTTGTAQYADPGQPCDGWIGLVPTRTVKINDALKIRQKNRVSKKQAQIQAERSRFFRGDDYVVVAYCPEHPDVHYSVLDGRSRLNFAIGEGQESIIIRLIRVIDLADAFRVALGLLIGTGVALSQADKKMAALRLRDDGMTEASVGSLLAVNQSTVHRWWNPTRVEVPAGIHSAIKTKLKGVMKNLSNPAAIDWTDITGTLRVVITECENAMDTAEDVVSTDETVPEAHAA